jgi:capsular polysaccharide transport system ATP-binding protein
MPGCWLKGDTRMIHLDSVHKSYATKHGMNHVLKDINLSLHLGERIGILGRNGAGKSTLLRILGRLEKPSSGACTFDMSTSWPLAFSGGFQGSLTGYDNLRFICRVYGIALEEQLDFVHSFSQLGSYLTEPIKTYSSGMKARLAFAASMMIDFDCYLIDEVVAVGDYTFREKCEEELFTKRQSKSVIIVSHDDSYIKKYCNRAFLLDSGQLHSFPDVDTALDAYRH